jgi:transglutaminase-like putative cysteine protease
MVVAVLFPWLLPGFHSNGLLQIHGDLNAKFVSIDPIVDIRPALLNQHPVDLFTVRSDRAAYWRFLALDQFDGRQWKASDQEATRGTLINSGLLRPNPSEPTNLQSTVATTLHQRYEFQGLTQPWLPTAFDPVSVSIVASVARYDPESQSLVAPNGTYQDFAYEVDSQLVVPTPDQLDVEPAVSGPERARYTNLPKDTPPQIAAIAHRLADGAPNIYRKVLAIQKYLKDFTYDLRVPAGHGVNDIVNFLTNTKAGYCEQFAGTMAVMLRSIGIPARVAVGFTPGTYDSAQGVYQVSSQDAHAWVEVLFPGYGWLAFEPTPTRTNPVAAPYVAPLFLNPPTGGGPGCANVKNPRLCNQETGRQGGRGGLANTRTRIGHDEGIPPTGVGTPTDLPAPVSPANRWRTLAFEALLALLGLALLLIPVAKWLGRRLTLARAHDPRSRVLAVYGVLTQRAADLGLGRRTHETPLEYRARLQRRIPALDGSFDLLTQLTARAAYSESAVERDQAHEAVGLGRRTIRDIRRAVALPIRVAGLFRLERFSLPKIAPND